MAKYYPKSQITPNLYTNGGEFKILSNNQEYVGDYYQTSTGETYIGKNPSISSTQKKLVPITSQILDEGENKLVDFVFNNESNIPFLSSDSIEINALYNKLKFGNSPLPPPTEVIKESSLSPNSIPLKQLQSGEIVRYFAKRINNLIYFEISKETYTQYQANDPKVDSNLYQVAQMSWSFLDFEVNLKIAHLLEKRIDWVGFTKWIQTNFAPPGSIPESESSPEDTKRIGY